MKIQVKRGLKANLPILSEGEIGFCTDTKEIYMGSNSGNTKVANLDDLDLYESRNSIFKREVFQKFPYRFADYSAIVSQEAISYLYPQNFTIDWTTNEVFVLYIPSGGTSTKRWIVVFNLLDGTYKTVFQASNVGYEGIVIKYEGTKRYMYINSSGTKLGKYDITTLPAKMASVAVTTEYDVGLRNQFNYRNGLWLVVQDANPLGVNNQYNEFALYDDTFTKVGTFSTDVSNTGLRAGTLTDYLPKTQGVALGDGCVVLCMGGYGNKTVDKPYSYQGIRILSLNGELLEEGIINNIKMIATLEANGYPCDRVESEGVVVSPDGDIYTLLIHQGTGMTQSTTQGLIIFKEKSPNEKALDLTPAAANYPSLNMRMLESGVFPLNAGKMINPLTGTALDTFDKILDFMIATDMRKFMFYSSSVTVTAINPTAIPSGTLVEIINTNNYTFRCTYYGTKMQNFYIYGATGARTQTDITLAGSPLYGKKIAILGTSLSYGNVSGNSITWFNKLGIKYSMTYYNYGDNGDTVANQTTEAQPCMVNRYTSIPTGLDYFILEGGANDKRLNVPLGTVSSTDPNTFMGAINVILNGMRTANPKAKLLCFTNWNRTTNANSLGLYDVDYVNAMIDVANAQGVQCFDNFHESGINFFNTATAAWQDEGKVLNGTANYHISDEAYTWLLPKYEDALSKL